MGDADNSQNLMSVEEVEAMIENAWSDLDDGLEGLFSFVSLLNDHNSYILSEIASWKRLRRCFTALNVFVIPIMLSIWIAFGSIDLVAPNSGTEAVIQTIVTVLMLVSGGIGFPLYVLALLKTVHATDDREKVPSTVSSVETNFPFRGDSLERMARLANRRFLDNVRQDIERRANRVEEVEQSRNSVRFETTESDAATQHVDLDAGSLKRVSDVQKEETDFCGFKVIILNKTQDLSVEIEKRDEDESRLPDLPDECPAGSIRSIAVENVGEGDSHKVCLKDSRDLAKKDSWQDQVFGL